MNLKEAASQIIHDKNAECPAAQFVRCLPAGWCLAEETLQDLKVRDAEKAWIYLALAVRNPDNAPAFAHAVSRSCSSISDLFARALDFSGHDYLGFRNEDGLRYYRVPALKQRLGLVPTEGILATWFEHDSICIGVGSAGWMWVRSEREEWKVIAARSSPTCRQSDLVGIAVQRLPLDWLRAMRGASQATANSLGEIDLVASLRNGPSAWKALLNFDLVISSVVQSLDQEIEQLEALLANPCPIVGLDELAALAKQIRASE